MSDESRLKWVSRNRARESNAKRIGPQIAELVESLDHKALLVEEAVRSVTGAVDDEFRKLCRIEGIENGVLRVGVSRASATADLSRRWSRKLRAVLPAKLKIKRIAFVYGTRGYRVD